MLTVSPHDPVSLVFPVVLFQGGPVDGRPGQSSQNSHLREGNLPKHEDNGQANSTGKPLLHTQEHHADGGDVEDQPIELVDLDEYACKRFIWTTTASSDPALYMAGP
jgi:hypothetical protein